MIQKTKQFPVVEFILYKDGKILVEKRRKDKKTHPGLIAIPAGAILEGETNEEAVIRETKEEFDIDITEYKYITSIVEPEGEMEYLNHFFLITSWTGEIKKLEAEELLWFDIHKKEDIDKFGLWPDKIVTQIIPHVVKSKK